MDYRKFLIKHLLPFYKNGIILFGHGLCEGVRDDFYNKTILSPETQTLSQ